MGDFNGSFHRMQRESRSDEPPRGPPFQPGPWGNEPYPRRGNNSPHRDHRFWGEAPPWRERENINITWIVSGPRATTTLLATYRAQGDRDHFKGNRRPKYSGQGKDLSPSAETSKPTTHTHSGSMGGTGKEQHSNDVSEGKQTHVDGPSLTPHAAASSQDAYKEEGMEVDPLTAIFDGDVEHCISAVATHLKLSRGTKLVIEASPTSDPKCTVPIAPSKLTRRTLRSGGEQNKPWEPPVKNTSPTTLVILNPVLDKAPDFPTRTLAQEFIKSLEKRWRRDSAAQLQVGLPYSEKFLIWARMMLIAEEDRQMLERAGILRGVFSILFRICPAWPLIQAFIDFWNVMPMMNSSQHHSAPKTVQSILCSRFMLNYANIGWRMVQKAKV
ncbi:uncharacterized protein LOC119272464 [Triticum dicoccoides]|uniref:uncharacterized protein LOC119272464 n=1 Tax=Triticum dicoccoides TaxID=85692 RepID=UPI00188F63DC|nr:uncharacterized protein LOC119272464 [Triticum dicoccoides]